MCVCARKHVHTHNITHTLPACLQDRAKEAELTKAVSAAAPTKLESPAEPLPTHLPVLEDPKAISGVRAESDVRAKM